MYQPPPRSLQSRLLRARLTASFSARFPFYCFCDQPPPLRHAAPPRLSPRLPRRGRLFLRDVSSWTQLVPLGFLVREELTRTRSLRATSCSGSRWCGVDGLIWGTFPFSLGFQWSLGSRFSLCARIARFSDEGVVLAISRRFGCLAVDGCLY